MDLILIALVIVVLLVLVLPPLFKIYRKNKFVHQCIDILPGDKWYPLVGTTYSILRAPAEDRWEVTSKRHKIFGPIFRSWYGSIPTVHIFKPNHIEKILKSHINIKKGRIYHVLKPWLGQGLLSATGAYWRRHRKIIRPAFYGAILDRYMDVFNECAQNFVGILEQHVEEEYTDIFSYINQIGLDVIAGIS
ncbi:cytochrome P450 4C1-like [Sitophilus oryzae]|uniref:Cytochrome P450 4C1-like n=1 Tax=Sitophilus oryzae TaxID=7048 RepID=A0A6J2X2D2_SITOR|nr:cytochrome P450 4C1-like [Sitophilus oryzae]